MAAAVEIARLNGTAAELRGLAVKSNDGARVRRLLALVFGQDGQSREEAARRFEIAVSERTIGRWPRGPGMIRMQPCPFHRKKDPGPQEDFKKIPESDEGRTPGRTSAVGEPIEIMVP